jgi:hypothetical protein
MPQSCYWTATENKWTKFQSGTTCKFAIFAQLTVCSLVLLPVHGLLTRKENFMTVATIGENYSSSETVHDIVADRDGNTYVVGSSDPNELGAQSDLPTAEVSGLANIDVFLAKVSASSQVEWVIRTGTSQDDSANTVDVDPLGQYLYVAGQTRGDFGLMPNHGGSDVFVLKYDLTAGPLPVRAWKNPIIIGSPADDSALALKVDQTGTFVYLSGYTRGSLFSPSLGNADAFLVRLYASNGSIETSRQFGTSANDYGSTFVLPDTADGPIQVGAETDRMIGTYEIGNLHVFRFQPSNLEPLGSLLVQTFSRESVTGLVTHAKFPGTLFSCGQSWLDEINGWDVSFKRLTGSTGNMLNIGRRNISVMDLAPPQYAKRYGSQNYQQDRPTSMLAIPSSGWILVGGTTSGAMGAVAQTSDSQNFIAAIDPRTGKLGYVAQEPLSQKQSYSSISAMVVSPLQPNGLVFAATRIQERTGVQYASVGTFGLPDVVMKEITIASPTPSPKPAGPGNQTQNNSAMETSTFPIAAVAGGVAGAFVLAVAAAVAFAVRRLKGLSEASAFKEGDKRRRSKRRRRRRRRHPARNVVSLDIAVDEPTRPSPAARASSSSSSSSRASRVPARIDSARVSQVEPAVNTSGLV